MLAITQFEVYVLDNGRWTIHARYGSDQRKAAVMDARTTEFTTGLPTKVVAETYFPEINESELVTAYVSPKARELRESAKTVKRTGRAPGSPRHAGAGGMKQRGGIRRGLGLRQFLMQGFVAAMMSLVAATIITAIVSWGMKRTVDAGVAISPAVSNAILTYGYAVFFFFFFLSLSRSKLPLHRLLSYLWQQAPEKQDKPADVKSLAAEIAPKIRAKQPSAIALAEAERALEDLKMMRGDPPPAPEIEVYDPPPLPQPEPEMSPQLREMLNPETPAQRKKREKREKKERQEKEAAEKLAADAAKRVAAIQAAAAQAAAAQVAAAQAAAAAASFTKAPPEPLPLERAVLRRFVADVVQPATAGTLPDDPVTRRGISLVIAGAAAALAETARTSDAGRLQLIEEALRNVGVNPASIGMFLHQHDELVAAPANATLVNLGRSALAKHLEGADVARILAVALAGWRTPFGQPAGPVPVAVAPDFAANTASLHDIYVLTELRMGAAFAMTPEGLPDNAAEAARDAAMGLHNSVVRSVLGTHHGHEVKHTGTGIFAQFKNAGAALTAAVEIQRRFTASYGAKLAVAVVENANHDDPLLTPHVVHQAQNVAARAADGEILAERRVQRAAGASADTRDDGENDGTALVKIATEAQTEEPALYEHVPANDFGSAPKPQAVNAP